MTEPLALKDQTDWLSRDNAAILARRIREYWRAAGHEIQVTIEPVIGRRNRLAGFCIRSTLIRGLPPAATT